jgi:hypothetical protein
MAQFRTFSWLDDDLTRSLNKWGLGFKEPGRYRGFDWDELNPLATTFEHSKTGVIITNSDSPITQTPISGIWLTQQGGVIREDAPIALTFTANPSGFGRIDVVYGQHIYVETVGGAAATYGIIVGTPSASPAAPLLPLPLEQVALGYMFIPASATDLTDAVYMPARVPNFANDDTIAHTDVEHIWTAMQTFPYLQAVWGVCYLDVAARKIDLTKDRTGTPLVGYELARNLKKNAYVIATLHLGTHQEIDDILPYPVDSTLVETSGKQKELTFLCLGNVAFTGNVRTSAVSGQRHYADFFQSVKVASLINAYTPLGLSTSWSVISSGDVMIDRINYMNKLLGLSKTTGSFFGTQLTHSSAGNYVQIATSAPTRTLDGIAITRVGTHLIVKPTGAGILLRHNQAPFSGHLPLWLSAEADMNTTSDEPLIFVQDTTHWRLVGAYDTLTEIWHLVGDVATGLGTTLVDYTNTVSGSLRPTRFTKKGRILRIQGQVDKNALVVGGNVIFYLPVAYRPTRFYQNTVAGIIYKVTPAAILGTCPVVLSVNPLDGRVFVNVPSALFSASTHLARQVEFNVDIPLD